MLVQLLPVYILHLSYCSCCQRMFYTYLSAAAVSVYSTLVLVHLLLVYVYSTLILVQLLSVYTLHLTQYSYCQCILYTYCSYCQCIFYTYLSAAAVSVYSTLVLVQLLLVYTLHLSMLVLKQIQCGQNQKALYPQTNYKNKTILYILYLHSHCSNALRKSYCFYILCRRTTDSSANEESEDERDGRAMYNHTNSKLLKLHNHILIAVLSADLYFYNTDVCCVYCYDVYGCDVYCSVSL